jgi:hypothetical protein
MNAQSPNWVELNQAMMAPLKHWNDLAAATADKIARQNLTLAQDLIELSAKQLQLAGDAKDLPKWAAEECKLLSEYGQKFVGRASDYLDMSRELRESVITWAESTAKTASEAAKSTTPA